MNKECPHVLILPEDQANLDIANGFVLAPGLDGRRVQVLPPAGGWTKVRDEFERVHCRALRSYPLRHMALIVDFEQPATRLKDVLRVVPEELLERVIVVGAMPDPEALRRTQLGTFESIGSRLAEDCRNNTRDTWFHDNLKHNAIELDRVGEVFRAILFPQQ